MSRFPIASLTVLLAACVDLAPHADPDSDADPGTAAADAVVACDVIVAGGSTAALAAALTSAREGALTCLIEPVDWVGGQLTASGVPAIDFAWHRVGALDVGAAGRNPVNQPDEFAAWMSATGNPGNCWVSKNCFRPDAFHDDRLAPAVAAEPNLQLYSRAVVKRVQTSGSSVTDVIAIQRTPLTAGDPFLSQVLADWYDADDSPRYHKQTIRFTGRNGTPPVVIDATEFGDVLVVSGAPYLQGVEAVDGSTEIADDTCGQATVFPFAIRYNPGPRTEPGNPFGVDHPSSYDLGSFSWDRVWSYRRILDGAHGSGDYNDVSLQNWNPGNDYAFGYLLSSRAEADASAAAGDWQGGVDIAAIAGAERHAYGYYFWYKAREPNGRASFLTLDRTILGSDTGLSKLPYVRDTRRSVGLENFVLASRHLRGHASQVTGTRFADRIAIGAYAIDIHPLRTCSLPGYIGAIDGETLPYFIPFRALTNRDRDNLLVAGKTMAQSFVTNAATRLQPIEWSTGVGAGAAAAHMAAYDLDSRDALANIGDIQTRIRRHAPLEWTIGGVRYPRPGEVLPPVAEEIYCPAGARFDEGYGFCVSGADAYGPFTRAMTERCQRYGGGPACTRTHAVEVAGRTLHVPRWSKTFAYAIRGDGPCPLGARTDPAYLNHCVEGGDVFGPFDSGLVEACVAAGGGDACYSQRWSAWFFRALVESM